MENKANGVGFDYSTVKEGDRVVLISGQKGSVVNMKEPFYINEHQEFPSGLYVEKDWNMLGQSHTTLNNIKGFYTEEK